MIACSDPLISKSFLFGELLSRVEFRNLFPVLCLLGLLVSSCSQEVGVCPSRTQFPLNDAAVWEEDDQLPFRFPLEAQYTRATFRGSNFQANGMETPTRREYHAADDFLAPAGSPVYAMADGEVSYSGRRGGYGWLVIVDHPQMNLYSLYGHLSPSRLQISKGPVEKGDLLGYLGDEWENGGSRENPLRTHLHLGTRGGQRSDYPTSGEWRWMAGWITPCPEDVGWIQPSALIASQQIPDGGFTRATGNLLIVWGIDLIPGLIFIVGGSFALILSLRQGKPYLLMFYGLLMIVAGVYLNIRGYHAGPAIIAFGGVLTLIGLYRRIQGSEQLAETDLDSREENASDSKR